MRRFAVALVALTGSFPTALFLHVTKQPALHNNFPQKKKKYTKIFKQLQFQKFSSNPSNIDKSY
jgi:hypothetical protein